MTTKKIHALVIKIVKKFFLYHFANKLPDPLPCHVATYDAGSFGIRSLGQEVGYSKRLLFFDDRPGTQIGLGDKDKPIDKLVFIGPDANVESYAGQTLLRFIRSVEKVKKTESNL